MERFEVEQGQLYYEVHGDGPQTVVFSHGLMFDGRMFDAQVRRLIEDPRYRCVVYDHRGQGRSAPAHGPFDIDRLTEDALALLEHLGLGPYHFVGLSMGGFVGMRLAGRHPELLRSLILIETSADAEPNRRAYRRMAWVFRWLGPRLIRRRVLRILFGPSFHARAEVCAQTRATLEQWADSFDRMPRSIVHSVHAVTERSACIDCLDLVRCPTLILVGEEDRATPIGRAERILQRIEGATLQVIPAAGHSASIEAPEAVNDALMSFLDPLR